MKEYQLKKIKYRASLNFDEELNKSNTLENRKSFNKLFRNELDILIPQFYRDGIQFYSFTINLHPTNLNILELVHFKVEEWVSGLAQEVELIEFSYFTIEKLSSIDDNPGLVKSNQTQYNIQGILGVRTLLGENDFLDIQIKKVFRSYYGSEYITIKRLKEIHNITEYWNYIIRENNFKFHRFVQYGINDYDDIYGHIADMELIYDEPNRFAFGLSEHRYSSTIDIKGIKIRQPNPKTLIIYLLNLFLWHKNYKINKNKIYQQIYGTKYSWEIIDNLEALKYNNITVFECLKKVYPQQLENINTIDIITKNWDKTLAEIIENNVYLSGLEFKEDAMEFKDGIYFINENKFLKFENQKNQIDAKMRNKNVCVYFNKNYYSLKKPILWLETIKKTVVNYEDFFVDLARYFNSVPLEMLKERPFLLLVDLNTVLFSIIIRDFFSKKNDSFFSKGLKKKVIIVDEFVYDIENKTIKLIGRELNSKVKTICYNFNAIGVVKFNVNPNIKNSEPENILNFLNESFEKEIVSILIFCNKFFFKKKI